jgi:hypothetical protein
MNPRSLDTKYVGQEPEWKQQPALSDRRVALIGAFNWYTYFYGKKEAKECIVDWLQRNGRGDQAQEFGRVPEGAAANAIGWLCRMNVMGLELIPTELDTINNAINQNLAAVRLTKAVTKSRSLPETPKVTIQDRLRDKITEAAADLEGMYDDMIRSGSKMTADFKPMAVLRGHNVSPNLIRELRDPWMARRSELTAVSSGDDGQLVEGYGNFGRMQVRNLIKFTDQVIADCDSYVQVKKTERAPRRRKPMSPERLTAKFRYLREFEELKLKSVPVTGLVNAQEAWLYDTKKRKLVHVMADTHVGTFSVKGSAIVGFDTAQTVQKTLRKPAEQLKQLLAVGKPAARKIFKDIKATETKFNGRGNENLIILRSW